MISVFKNVEESSPANYHPVSLPFMVKVSEKLVNNRIVNHLEKCAQYGLGLLDQLQIFCQLYLIESLGPLTGLGLLELLHLIYPRLLTRFGILSSSQT